MRQTYTPYFIIISLAKPVQYLILNNFLTLTYPSKLKYALFLVSLFLCPLSLSANNSLFSEAQTLDLGSVSGSSFLPVKQAYQPTAWFDGEDLVIQWDIAQAHYLYRDRTKFSSNSLKFLDIQFEEGTLIQDEFFQKEMVVYRDLSQMRLTGLSGSGRLTIEAQGCADAGLCYPPTDFWFDINTDHQRVLYLEDLPIQPQATVSKALKPANHNQISSLFIALAFAFLGGLILNLMPCVFPVLAIKALKISSASEQFSARLKEASAYTAGILTTVLTIASILIALRAGGSQIGWGFQLQSPFVVIALTTLFFVIGLSFSGWFEFGSRFAGTGQSLTEEGKPLGSYFTGVLAMVVASPCSAPFMAAAMGYAISQSIAVSLLVFSALGLGMAAPLILLYLLPTFAEKLPRPGPWMETLKQFLAFPMYLTCIWLIWVLIAQIGATGAALTMVALCLLAMAIWSAGKSNKTTSKLAAFTSLLAALLFMFSALQQDIPKDASSRFELAKLDGQVGGAQPVFLDVTADWCITCKFNEKKVLYTPDIQALFDEKQVIYVVADWTNQNPEIGQLLDRYQRVGIPLYLYFPAYESSPIILPQVLTKNMIRELLI